MPVPTKLRNPTICGWGDPFHSYLTHAQDAQVEKTLPREQNFITFNIIDKNWKQYLGLLVYLIPTTSQNLIMWSIQRKNRTQIKRNMKYRVSHLKLTQVIWLCWGYIFWFLLIFLVLQVHEIGTFMSNSSVFIFLMLRALYRMICKNVKSFFGENSLNVTNVKLFSNFFFGDLGVLLIVFWFRPLT